MTCLIVDDSATMRRILHRAASSMGFTVCREAASGREALRSLRDHRADLIVTDWRMPLMSGVDFVAELRRNPATANVPVLMVTACDSHSEVLEAMRVGVTAYLVKPFSLGVLQSKLKDLCEDVIAAGASPDARATVCGADAA